MEKVLLVISQLPRSSPIEIWLPFWVDPAIFWSLKKLYLYISA